MAAKGSSLLIAQRAVWPVKTAIERQHCSGNGMEAAVSLFIPILKTRTVEPIHDQWS